MTIGQSERLPLGLAITLAMMLFICGVAAAAEDASGNIKETAAAAGFPEGGEEEWKFEVSMYAWLSSVSQTLNKGDVEASSYMSFGDIWDVLDFAGFLHAEAQHGKWGLFSELDYVKLSNSGKVRLRQFPLVQLDSGGGLKETIAELGGMRSFGGSKVGFDLLGGARYFGMEVEASAGPLGVKSDKDWVDPFVGGRLRFRLSERWNLSFRGDVGGFGVGSDVTVNAASVLRYQISESVAIGVGYRYMDVDYDKSGLELGLKTYGPLIGMAFSF